MQQWWLLVNVYDEYGLSHIVLKGQLLWDCSNGWAEEGLTFIFTFSSVRSHLITFKPNANEIYALVFERYWGEILSLSLCLTPSVWALLVPGEFLRSQLSTTLSFVHTTVLSCVWITDWHNSAWCLKIMLNFFYFIFIFFLVNLQFCPASPLPLPHLPAPL